MGAKDRQKLRAATFQVFSSIWGQDELGIPNFSANFPKRVLFVPCVYSRGLNITPFSPSWGEAGGTAGGGPVRRLEVLLGGAS